jgi:hypothetical protein
MLPLESDPLPLLSLPWIHCDTPMIKQDSVNGVMRDMYPMDLFYLLLQMNRSNPIIVKARENEKPGLFVNIFPFSTRSMKNRNPA